MSIETYKENLRKVIEAYISIAEAQIDKTLEVDEIRFYRGKVQGLKAIMKSIDAIKE
jgi:hypothetical protein